MTAVYAIRPGDSLGEIADSFDMTIEKLLDLNPQIENPDLIIVGQPINVPSNGAAPNGTEVDDENLPSWYVTAMNELGTMEIPGNQHNPRILQYHKTTSLRATDDETPWCSSFVNWCFKQSGINGTNSAAARSWLRWGKKLRSPKVGCVVVFSRGSSPTSGHVGFYKGSTHTHIEVLGGNQSNSVNISSYHSARLLGYRWPK